ncbi:MAG: DNA-processing protein DprA [Clostridia bacterium]|nr:DNA-processing protein DprA [Clostridia bacterium]
MEFENLHDLYYIWLSSVLNPGNSSAKILLEYFDSIEDLFGADAQAYMYAGISEKDAKRLENKDLTLANEYLAYCRKDHLGLLCYDNPYYPQRLKKIENPPALLYYRGRVEHLDDYPLIAMVGTRSCSERGYRQAYATAYKAASYGAVIVTGLAVGIDSACTRGALDADAYNIGVLGCGIDRIYPWQNKDLFYRLSARGLIISEFAPFSRPEGTNFPIRNRVISGLGVATVIFEANERSGALITADHALYQGRQIFAIPGAVDNSLYAGPLGLIKSGAIVFTEAEDIVSEYSLMFPHRINVDRKVGVPEKLIKKAVENAFLDNILVPDKENEQNRVLEKPARAKKRAEVKKEPPKGEIPVSMPQFEEKGANTPAPKAENPNVSALSAQEKAIYDMFKQKEVLSADEIAEKGIKIDDALSSLTLLEVYGLIEMLPGGNYRRLG